MDHFELADKLEKEKNLTDDEFAGILLCEEPEFGEYLAEKARAVREQYYGKDVYLRDDDRLSGTDNRAPDKGSEVHAGIQSGKGRNRAIHSSSRY